jgi:RNA polymerase sigma-54 factor
LLIQLERKEHPSPATELAKKIIRFHFELFAKKHYDKLEKFLDIDSVSLKEALEEIIHLNPRPGNAYESAPTIDQYIVPDFILINNSGELSVVLNSRNAPELRISNSFRDMMRDYKNVKSKTKDQKEAIQFIKQKIEAAKWFIDTIKQRQHTLLSTMNAILHLQYEYLLTGDETRLKPMILKDVAEITQLDISTISRVSNSKYVQTEFGTFPLKYFFSEGMTMESGEEVSTREVKKILSDIISSEDQNNPISDQELTDQLKSKGYNIARRTVAKYREQLNIPVARLRKKM